MSIETLIAIAAGVCLLAFALTFQVLRLRRRRERRAERREAHARQERVQERVYRRELRGVRHLESTDGPGAA